MDNQNFLPIVFEYMQFWTFSERQFDVRNILLIMLLDIEDGFGKHLGKLFEFADYM
jgi:hypothetical protein